MGELKTTITNYCYSNLFVQHFHVPPPPNYSLIHITVNNRNIMK